jgi:type II secretory pathway pseudopilin PulG
MMSRRGITLLEILVILGVVGVLMVLLVPLLSRRHGHPNLRLTDVMNLRSITQSMNAWAHDNKGRYPSPSIVDRNNAVLETVDPGEKNTTGAMMSLMIFANMITPEITVSPIDMAAVQINAMYEYAEPSGAIDPLAALWDPKFKGTPKDDVPGAKTEVSHVSYAHAPFAKMRTLSADTSLTTAMEAAAKVPILSGRGPIFEPDPKRAGAFRPSHADPTRGKDSPAYTMHKMKGEWNINIAFQDAHVEYHPPTLDNGDHIFVRGSASPDGTPQDAYLRQYWRGIPFNVSYETAFGGSLVGTPDDPYAEADGPHVYVDGDK